MHKAESSGNVHLLDNEKPDDAKKRLILTKHHITLFAFLTVCVLILATVSWLDLTTPQATVSPQQETILEVLQQDGLAKGTFIETTDGSFLMVIHCQGNGFQEMQVMVSIMNGFEPRICRDLARQTKRIIRADDLDWPKLAKKFLTQ